MITKADICLHYICVECYTEYQVEMQSNGSSDIQFAFANDADGLQHLDDANEPTHSLAYRVVRKTPDELAAEAAAQQQPIEE